MFSVIELKDGLQLVPNSWIEKEDNICLWPTNVLNQVKLKKMISSQVEPEASWGEFEFLRLFGEADSYVKGVEKLKLYSRIYEIDSNQSDRGKAQRRELKRKTFSDNDTDEDSQSDERSCPKIPEKLASNEDSSAFVDLEQVLATDNGIMCASSSSCYQSIPILISTQDCSQTFSDSGHIPAVKEELQAETSNCNCKENNEKLTKVLELILGKTNTLIKKVETLEEKMSLMTHSPDAENNQKEVSAIMKRFPLKNINELEAMESFLCDDNNYKILVKSLTLIGGVSLYFIVINILKRVFPNELAELFSWAGAKKKRPFKALHFSKAILEAARFRYSEVTEDEIANLIANWLRHAKQRRERKIGTPSKKIIFN